MRKTAILVLALLAVVSFASLLSPSLATTQLVSLQGRVLQSGSPATSGNIAVTIWSASSGGSVIYSDNFANAINDGFFDLMLGSSSELNLTYGTFYYLDISISGQDISWTSPAGSTVDRIQFQSQNGQISSASIAANAINSTHLNSSAAYNFGKIGINTTIPNATLDVYGGIRLTGGNWTCGSVNGGELRFQAGAPNADDRLWMCMKNSTNVYNWALIARGG